MSGLHGLDIAMAVLLGLSVIVGLWRGLVFELMSLVGWVVAYLVAVRFSGHVGPFLPIGEPGSPLNHAASLVVTFVAALMVWALVARLLQMLISATPLTFIDRTLGGAFGLLRGLVLLLLVVTAMSLTPTGRSAWWNQSRGVQLLGVIVEGLRPMMPPHIQRWFAPPRSKV
jgi:membrane protein required for colicin V production